MPHYDVVARHRTVVHAAPDLVFAAIREADLTGGPLTRSLFALRAVPAALGAIVRSPRAAWDEYHDRTSTHQRTGRLQTSSERAFGLWPSGPPKS
ncbi:MAG TPA: hypothetical protein VNJ04_14345 [Gemmatimonadaceae bacterium]|nr:hypothetical protein [Gemmatimonadaceae bacterium]